MAEACFYVIKSQLFNINLNSKPFLNKEEFWEWTIDVKGNHWYGKYEFPNKICSDLIDFDNVVIVLLLYMTPFILYIIPNFIYLKNLSIFRCNSSFWFSNRNIIIINLKIIN